MKPFRNTFMYLVAGFALAALLFLTSAGEWWHTVVHDHHEDSRQECSLTHLLQQTAVTVAAVTLIFSLLLITRNPIPVSSLLSHQVLYTLPVRAPPVS